MRTTLPILLIAITLMTSPQAWAMCDAEKYLSPRAESSLPVPPNSILVQEGKLIITFNNEFYWGDSIVLLRDTEGNLIPRLNTSTGNVSAWFTAITRILLFLIDEKNQFVSRQELIAEGALVDPEAAELIWNPNTLSVIILILRRSFEDIDPKFASLRTLSGIGYAWDTGGRDASTMVNGVEIHRGLREVFWQGQWIPFSESEFATIELLLKYKGQIVSGELLNRAAHPDNQTPIANIPSAVSSQMRHIRDKFRTADKNFGKIRAERSGAPGSYRWLDWD